VTLNTLSTGTPLPLPLRAHIPNPPPARASCRGDTLLSVPLLHALCCPLLDEAEARRFLPEAFEMLPRSRDTFLPSPGGGTWVSPVTPVTAERYSVDGRSRTHSRTVDVMYSEGERCEANLSELPNAELWHIACHVRWLSVYLEHQGVWLLRTDGYTGTRKLTGVFRKSFKSSQN
jgi:hypothetical protein